MQKFRWDVRFLCLLSSPMFLSQAWAWEEHLRRDGQTNLGTSCWRKARKTLSATLCLDHMTSALSLGLAPWRALLSSFNCGANSVAAESGAKSIGLAGQEMGVLSLTGCMTISRSLYIIVMCHARMFQSMMDSIYDDGYTRSVRYCLGVQ